VTWPGFAVSTDIQLHNFSSLTAAHHSTASSDSNFPREENSILTFFICVRNACYLFYNKNGLECVAT